MSRFLGRLPFAALGAAGLFSAIGDWVELDGGVMAVLDAWRLIARGFWNLPLVAPLSLLDLSVPPWALDYLTMAAICFAAMVIADRRDHRRNGAPLHRAPIMLALCLLWPLAVIGYTALYLAEQETDAAEVVVLFFEMALYALVLIAVNYALLRGLG